MSSGSHVEPASLPGAAGDATLPVSASAPIPVLEGYERWAPTYDQAPNPLLAREERYLTPLLVGVSNKRVLDLACGTGRWLARLLTHGAECGVGVDYSAAMLKTAGSKSVLTGRVARADCENLPFRVCVFDLAICSFVLGHIQDLLSLARELASVMRPGSDVFVSDLHPEAYARGWRTGFRDGRTACQIETIPRTTDEIVRAFCGTGFEYLSEVSLRLGEPEKPIFVQAGKSESFAEACQVPAVLVGHFRRLSLPTESRGA